MVIYLIGALFTCGYTLAVEKHRKTNKYGGFIGACNLFLTCLIWPVVIGFVLVEWNTDEN